LRGSGLPYSVIRATGLVSADGNALFSGLRRLEGLQGDRIAGRITRTELACLVVAALESAYSEGKTFEVRRDETESGNLT